MRLPKLTAQRRELVLAQLEAALEGAKTEIRLRLRSMVGQVRTASHVGDDEKLAVLRQLELDVAKVHAALSVAADSAKLRLLA
ncbi:MAG: hypothetical protein ACKERG_03260 [Candidatus Hodgkinia cicadicola]